MFLSEDFIRRGSSFRQSACRSVVISASFSRRDTCSPYLVLIDTCRTAYAQSSGHGFHSEMSESPFSRLFSLEVASRFSGSLANRSRLRAGQSEAPVFHAFSRQQHGRPPLQPGP